MTSHGRFGEKPHPQRTCVTADELLLLRMP